MKKIVSLILVAVILVTCCPIAFAGSKNISVNQAVSGFLSSSSDLDTFYFTLSKPGSLQLKFKFDVDGDYTVKLYKKGDSGSDQLVQSTDFYYSGQSADGTVTMTALKVRNSAGDYYVQVSRMSYGDYVASTYNLTVLYADESAAKYEKQPNSSAAAAYAIATNSEIIGNLDSQSDVDYYKFTISEYGALRILFAYDYAGDYEVTLYSMSDTGALESKFSQNFYYGGTTTSGYVTQNTNKIRQAPGTYYIQVRRMSYGDFSNNDYKLNVNYTAEPASTYEKQPNGNAAAACLIDTNKSVFGNLDSSADQDYYRIFLDRDGTVSLRFSFDYSGDYTVTFYSVDANGMLIKEQSNNFYYNGSTASGTYSGSGKTLTCPRGEYYVLVQRMSYGDFSNADYVLTVTSSVQTSHFPSNWAEGEVDDAIEEGLIPDDMQSSYGTSITRGEFCTLVVTMLSTKEGTTVSGLASHHGVQISSSFTDTSDYNILVANALGIVNGRGGGIFDPNGSISREEAACMLARTAEVLGVTRGNTGGLTFSDSGKISTWAHNSVMFVSSTQDPTTGNRVMGGMGDGTFSPHTSYTREQSYLTILRLFRAL